LIGGVIIAMTIGMPDLSACTRNTHTYAGEADHQVLGQNRVAFTSWWAQLGQSQDLVILSCDTGEGLSVRMREYDMTENSPFDRRDEALSALAKMERSGFLFTLDQIAENYARSKFDATRISMDKACACEALKEAE